MASARNTCIWHRIKATVAVLSVIVVTGCAATFDNHGYVPPEEELQAILPGVDTRETVESSVGRPSAAGVMRDEAWFYTAYRVRNFAYRAPEIIERDVVAISFTDEGVVQNIERFGLEQGQMIQLSRRVTESGVQEVTFLNQILRNFGRIDVGNILGGN